MPKHTRNFWLDVKIDGRQTKFSGGPAAKDGGFEATIKMRDAGGRVFTALTIKGRAWADGRLALFAEPNNAYTDAESFRILSHR